MILFWTTLRAALTIYGQEIIIVSFQGGKSEGRNQIWISILGNQISDEENSDMVKVG